MSYRKYQEKFTNILQVIEHCGGTIIVNPTLVEKQLTLYRIDPTTVTIDDLTSTQKYVKNRYIGTAFLLISDKK